MDTSSNNTPIVTNSNQLAVDSNTFLSYLDSFGLPTDNIIASTEERNVIGNNIGSILGTIPLEQRKEARYLSKFIGATSIGLFDAGLNFIWNEVILTLRKKVSIYGIDLFYDAAVSGKNREMYKDEQDLDGIKDLVLIDTCKKLELISDIVHKKVHHILVMRNDVAASHPNVESIGSYELLGWLQTCIKDVIQDQPSESSIRIKSLVENIKSRSDALDAVNVSRFSEELKNLSLPHVHNLIITLFGIFVSNDTSQILRANVAKIAPSVWDCSLDRVRYKIGVTIDGYHTNFQQEKYDKGLEFLGIVKGRMYESLSTRIIALNSLAERLSDAHIEHDNYWHEPPIMREILQYCRSSKDIPKEVMPDLVRSVLRCRLGRGLTYKDGVSPNGLELYNQFLRMLDDNGIVECILSFFDSEINIKLQNAICQNHLKSILGILQSIAISERLKEVISYLNDNIPNVHSLDRRKEFKQLSSPFITWSN